MSKGRDAEMQANRDAGMQGRRNAGRRSREVQEGRDAGPQECWNATAQEFRNAGMHRHGISEVQKLGKSISHGKTRFSHAMACNLPGETILSLAIQCNSPGETLFSKEIACNLPGETLFSTAIACNSPGEPLFSTAGACNLENCPAPACNFSPIFPVFFPYFFKKNRGKIGGKLLADVGGCNALFRKLGANVGGRISPTSSPLVTAGGGNSLNPPPGDRRQGEFPESTPLVTAKSVNFSESHLRIQEFFTLQPPDSEVLQFHNTCTDAALRIQKTTSSLRIQTNS
jgi:hypothetical protein